MPPIDLSVNPDGVDVFTASGWTVEQWDTLYEFFTESDSPGSVRLAWWMCNPLRGVDERRNRTISVTPGMVVDFFARYGEHATQVLTASSAGASERFTRTFCGPRPDANDYLSTVIGWRYATRLGLDEAQAVGWAGTGHLHCMSEQVKHGLIPLNRVDSANMIAAWTERFGPAAYLWPLAGFTLAEATLLRKTRPVMTEQELRVMAALNGAILPAGI